MFKKLRNRIIIITMAITTVVLVSAGGFIMLFSSVMRSEPKPRSEPDFSNIDSPRERYSQELEVYIKTDREEGNKRLLSALVCVGITVEAMVFLVTLYLSKKIIEPVKDSYNKQKLFIANASHELKTPLAVIQANMEALDVSKSNKKWKDNIEDEISHANKLVLDLLQLAKMDAGDAVKNPVEKVDLFSEISKRVEMFKPKFSGNISLESKSQAKSYLLSKQDILQVLDILLDNATKYGDKKVSISLNKNSISISNDGATISKNEAKKIFDRFYQTDKTKEGSGLGLAIAKAVCERNKWDISCNVQENTTKFIVTFS